MAVLVGALNKQSVQFPSSHFIHEGRTLLIIVVIVRKFHTSSLCQTCKQQTVRKLMSLIQSRKEGHLLILEKNQFVTFELQQTTWLHAKVKLQIIISVIPYWITVLCVPLIDPTCACFIKARVLTVLFCDTQEARRSPFNSLSIPSCAHNT